MKKSKKKNSVSVTHCVRCHKDPCEYYMLKHEVWAQATTSERILCFACVEGSLGRPLMAADFLDCLLNILEGHLQSIKKEIGEK